MTSHQMLKQIKIDIRPREWDELVNIAGMNVPQSGHHHREDPIPGSQYSNLRGLGPPG